MTTVIVWLALAAVAWVAVRTGAHQRLPLALGPLSLDTIPDRAARRHGGRTLFTACTATAWRLPGRDSVGSDTDWSAVRIRDTADAVGGALRHLGVEVGGRVAILKPNHLDIHLFILAAVRAGAVAAPMNGSLDPAHVGPYLTALGARHLITDAGTLRRVLGDGGGLGVVEQVVVAERRPPHGRTEELEMLLARAHPDARLTWIEDALAAAPPLERPVPRSANAPFCIVHTSGTTGFPKAVILTSGAQSHAIRGWLCYVPAAPRVDRAYLAVPNNHQAVILTFHALLLLGLRAHWTAGYDRDGFDAAGTVRALRTGGYTGFFGFPVTYTALKEEDLGSLRRSRMRIWATTADASHEAIIRRFVAVGWVFRSVGIPLAGSLFLDAQGSSEVGTPSVLRYYTRFTRRFGRRIGRPGSTPFGPHIRITGASGERVRGSGAGRLEVRGRSLFTGYWNDPERTEASVKDGWFFTGDVARYSSDGHIVQLDREVDVIRTSTGPIYSLPMEEVIHHHPAVHDVCVYGARQPNGFQLPAAAVALRRGAAISEAELLSVLNEALGATGRLSRIEILPWSAFPMGVTGKTLKRVFRERSEAPPGDGVLQDYARGLMGSTG